MKSGIRQQFGRLSVDETAAPVDALPVVLPEAAPPIELLVLGGLEGELDGEAGEAEPALDGFAAVFSRGWPFESLQCVDAEIVLLAPAAGDEVDCAVAETAPKHTSVVERISDEIFMGSSLGWMLPPS